MQVKPNKTNRPISVVARLQVFVRFVLFLVALTGVLLYTRVNTPTHVSAAVPNTLNFQARLLTGAGGIVPDGTYNVEFKLYTSSASAGSSQGSCTGDATCVWTETRLTTDAANLQVKVRSGYVSVYLGDKTTFPSTVPWDQQLYLTMNIGGTAAGPTWDGEMTPRLKLTSVPYAQQAARATQLYQTSGANTGTLAFNTVANNPVIQLPDIAGTNNVLLQSGTTNFTQGSIPFTDSTGRLTQNNANFFFDNTNNTLGVGTTRTGAIDGTGNSRVVIQGSGSTSATSALNIRNSTGAGSLFFVRDDGNVGIGTVTPTQILTLGEGADRTINVETRASNAAGRALTIQAGAAGAGATPFNGGSLTLQGGAGTGTGVQGLVSLASSAYTAAATETSAVTFSLAQSKVDNNSTIPVNATAINLTVTVPAPTLNVVGRLLYITAVNGSNIFTLAPNNGTSFTLSPNTTATLIWNGFGWTNAGVDGGSSSYIQNQTNANQTANFRISGTGQANTSYVSPLFTTLDSAGSANSPDVTFRSGNAASGNNNSSGALVIKTGDASNGSNGSSGNITIDSGLKIGSGTTGSISIGATNASALTLGRSGFTTTNGGALTVGGTVTVSGFATAGIVTNTAAGVLGTVAAVPVANGGTNITSYTVGDLIYASAATTLSKLADVATGSCLISGGVGVAPSWGTCGAGTGANTALSNLTTTSINQSLIANATNTFDIGASGTTWRSGYFGTGVTTPLLQSPAALSITPGGALTVGSVTQSFTLQGTGSSVITANGGGGTTTVGFSGTPTGAVTYNFDRAATAGTYTICSTVGNCAGTGSGVTAPAPGGTANRVAKFTAGQTIGDSSISDTGTLVTVLGSTNLTIQGGTATIGTTSTLGNLALHDGNGQTTTLRAGDSAGNLTFVLPTADGSSSNCLKTNGLGVLSFANCNNGSGSGGAVTLQDAYAAGNTIATTDNRDVAFSFADTAADSSFSVNLQCTTCTSTGGRFAVQNGGTDVFTVKPNSGGTLVKVASAAALQVQNTTGNEILTVDTSGNQLLLGKASTLSGKVVVYNSANANTVTIQPNSITASYTLQFPTLAGGTYDFCTSSGNCGSAGAPSSASYLTLTNDATLTNERALGVTGNITAVDGGVNSSYTINTVANPTFSGLLTASNTAATALAVTGAPTNSATSSLIQAGAAIAGGNSSVNGGTYIGLNAPSTGAGSTADFLNFQLNGVSKLKVTNAGLVDSATGFAVAGTSGVGKVCAAGEVLSNSTYAGGILTSAGTCISPAGTGANTALSNLTATSINQSLIANANNSLDIGATATTYRTGYYGTSVITPSTDSAASAALTLGATNATSVTIGRAGVTTTIQGSTSLGTVTAGVWNGTAIGLGYGGTGATTAQGAINAISGLTTTGDLQYHDGTNTTRLPRGANGQCLTSNTTTIVWSTCAAGGASSLQGAYDTSGATSPQILLSSTNGGIKIRDGTTAVTGNLLQLQNNAGTATYFGISATTLTLQDSSGNNALVFDSTTSELKIYGNSTNPTNYARLYYDDTASEAVFAASTGTTRVGSGSGNVTIPLTGQADVLNFSKTYTAAGAYSQSEFNISRAVTGGTNALTGNVLKVEDLSTFTTGSSAPSVLYVNQNNTSATGNLILAQSGGGVNDKFKVDVQGTVTIAAGQSYTGAGSLSLTSAAASALTLDSGTTGALNIGTGSSAKTITVGNATGATSVTLQAGTGGLVLKPITANATALTIQDSAAAKYLILDTTNARLQVGDTTADATGVLLVLDTKNTSGDPTGVNGAMYYNSNSNTFRCFENSVWSDCLSHHVIILGADVANGNATANTISDVTGLSFTGTAGQTYRFHANILYTAAALTTGSRWSVSGSASPTLLSYTSAYGLTATTQVLNYASAYDIPAASSTASLSLTGNTTIIEGIYKPSATGPFVVRFASEIANSAITAKAGSTLEWW